MSYVRRAPERLSIRSIFTGLGLLALSALQAFGQETPQETAALDRVGPWKVVNAVIFAILLIWFVAKKAPAFFNARSADIQKAIQDATGLKMNADLRYSEIDRKMATLGEEVEKLRKQSDGEFAREHQRMQEQTASEIARMRHNASNEIEALRGEAARHVRERTADLALGLAERRLQDQFAPGEPQDLVNDLVRLIERGKNG